MSRELVPSGITPHFKIKELILCSFSVTSADVTAADRTAAVIITVTTTADADNI